MSIPPISNCICSNLFSIEKLYKTRAVELFGKDLAESLKIRDGNWKKVMKSWDIFLMGCTIIKESKNYFLTQPKHIYCEIQSNDGLILKIPTFNLDATPIKSATLITPYGYINLEFKYNGLLHQFTERLAEKFYKQPLCETNSSHIHHSFTLSQKKLATFKPSYYYDVCVSALREEFGKDEYSRTEALQVYQKLRGHVNIRLEGQATVPKSILNPPQYVSRGTQTNEIIHIYHFLGDKYRLPILYESI